MSAIAFARAECSNWHDGLCDGVDMSARRFRPEGPCWLQQGQECPFFAEVVLPIGKGTQNRKRAKMYADAKDDYMRICVHPTEREKACPDCGGPMYGRQKLCVECSRARAKERARKKKQRQRLRGRLAARGSLSPPEHPRFHTRCCVILEGRYQPTGPLENGKFGGDTVPQRGR